MCLQLQNTLNGYIDVNQPISFDKYIISLDIDIMYEDGYFYINCDGIYYISWWISLNNSNFNKNLSFKIKSCKGHNIESCISSNSSQVCGDGIVNVTDSHLKFALINSSKSKIMLSQLANIKANISIFKISPSISYSIPDSKFKSTFYMNTN